MPSCTKARSFPVLFMARPQSCLDTRPFHRAVKPEVLTFRYVLVLAAARQFLVLREQIFAATLTRQGVVHD